jgi:hypothetical protein
MSKTILHDFSAKPDQGNLKRQAGEYAFMQNVRGWGQRGKKRQGVQTRATLEFGVMGIFDIKVDGDPLSPDKILVYDNNGSIILYDWSELISIFDFLFDTGSELDLQSPDLNWWKVAVDVSGAITVTGIAAPGTTISSDLFVAQNALFGFKFSTTISRLYIQAGTIKTGIFGPSTPVTSYTTAQSFETGFGPVFQDGNLDNFRLSVDNTGSLNSTQV